jgi:hypothetical protein
MWEGNEQVPLPPQKMKYFELYDVVEIPERWHLGDVLSEDGTEPDLSCGIPYLQQEALRSSMTYGEKALDFCLTSFAVPIGTRRVADAIGKIAGADLQSIPVDIRGAYGMMVLNATRVVRCLDETKSEFIKWTAQDHRSDLAGQYRQVTRLVIDPNRVPPAAHFFRIEGWLVALVVSEAVKSALLEAGCLGAKFVQLTD